MRVNEIILIFNKTTNLCEKINSFIKDIQSLNAIISALITIGSVKSKFGLQIINEIIIDPKFKENLLYYLKYRDPNTNEYINLLCSIIELEIILIESNKVPKGRFEFDIYIQKCIKIKLTAGHSGSRL